MAISESSLPREWLSCSGTPSYDTPANKLLLAPKQTTSSEKQKRGENIKIDWGGVETRRVHVLT
jgi:hypothetical protein